MEEGYIIAHSYSPILTKDVEANLTTYAEGKLRFTTDTHKIFLDVSNNARIEFTDFVKGLTEAQIKATNNPLPKLYLASDTHKLLVYNTTSSEWETIAADNSGTADFATNSSTADYASNIYTGLMDFGDLDEEVTEEP